MVYFWYVVYFWYGAIRHLRTEGDPTAACPLILWKLKNDVLAAVRYIFGIARHIQSIFEGSVEPDPAQYGFTTEEERLASGCPQVRSPAMPLLCVTQQLQPAPTTDEDFFCQWPGVKGEVHPPNEGLRLFGGAAFERCLQEFVQAALVLGFPAGKTRGKQARSHTCSAPVPGISDHQ